MLTLFALTAAAVEPAALPLFHRQVYIDHATEPMHWFAADFMDVERAGCRIGVPVNEMHADEAIVACYFPAGRGADQAPDSPDLRAAYKTARKLVKQRNARTADLHVRYVGTWQEVVVADIVPLPAGDNPHVDRLYDQGTAQFAVRRQGGDKVIERAPFTGMSSLGGLGLVDPIEDASFLAVELPEALAGSSVLRHSWREDADPVLRAAEQAIREAVLAALPAYERGERAAPALSFDHTLPEGFTRAIGGSVSLYARHRYDEDGAKRGEDIHVVVPFHAPLPVAREQVLRFERQVPELRIALEYTLDLPAGTATLTAVDHSGREVRATWSVEVALVEDGPRLYPEAVRSALVDKSAEVVDQATELREDQLQLAVPPELAEGYRVIDLYAAAVHAADGPWLGEPTWTVVGP